MDFLFDAIFIRNVLLKKKILKPDDMATLQKLQIFELVSLSLFGTFWLFIYINNKQSLVLI